MTAIPDGVVLITGSGIAPAGTTGPFTFSCWIGGEKFSGHGETQLEASEDLRVATNGRVSIVVGDFGRKDILRLVCDSFPVAITESPKLKRGYPSQYPGSGHYGSKRKKGKDNV